ncbi:group I intron-associated PD-(D/E)XK endonuclease [Natrialba asiatica]|uniref:PD(D/E)XK endonuclease domain-containing protein n=1 Tax=Natrialba asiatica (strain ATCC 700177 / DSM 12278 / JCM 9576 / FERM P-10747 / NBRC 102637 / 172P1) TaxID=29540 RepID=M0AM20_NATA1|nr:group I intron-associated PD-(D/E)XK endonuclease [Natrialba asiatica]ELY98428.1 hypothetical protein C481_17402 [Natrialba asiatica DSM 12278]
MSTKQTGDETEAKVMSWLIAAGYTVSVPFGDNEKYDLVLDTGAELVRVQCKTGWREEDGAVLRFKTTSKTTVDGTVTRVDYGETINAFAVRCPVTDKLYWVPVEEAGSKSTYLRLKSPKIDHPSVNLAAEYRFDEVL